MAEFQEVAKEYARMCTAYEGCGGCPLNKIRDKAFVCRYWSLMTDPEKAEEVVMQWAKENPEKTNADKFKDTYGFDIEYLFRSDIKKREEWARQVYEEP